jgi:hypothetical protein
VRPNIRPAAWLLTLFLCACAGGDGGRTVRSDAAPEPPATRSAEPTAQSCFAPLPGHPTLAERQAFVADVGPLATAAERTHGVPAAAITAMAIQESGYGWTELAQQTNNILAWKYTTSEDAGGRDSWVLDCGTSRDSYIVFANRATAVDFVAQRLASSDNYAAATERYRRDRADGVPVVEAVNRWVAEIADPYSSQPEAYRTAIVRVMNNPLDPADQRSPDRNLYRLSESQRAALDMF